MFVTDPAVPSKLACFAFNLQRRMEDPAYRNAFGKSVAEVEAVMKQRYDELISAPPISQFAAANCDFPGYEVSIVMPASRARISLPARNPLPNMKR